MEASLYIDQETLVFNEDVSEESVKCKLEHFVNYCAEFLCQKDKIFYHNDIFDVLILNDYKLVDIYDDTKKTHIDKDTREQFKYLFDRSEETPQSIPNIIERIVKNPTDPIALLVLNSKSYKIEPYYIICDTDSWYNFHRKLLSKSNMDATSFIEECRIYFPELYFHEGVKESIKFILDSCRIKIIKCLTALNDKLPCIKKETNNGDRRTMLSKFSSSSGFETTLEGHAARKDNFMFCFEDENGSTKDICCEPHMKIFKDDRDKTSSDRRIYFHEGKSNIQNGKILIGWIGKHL